MPERLIRAFWLSKRRIGNLQSVLIVTPSLSLRHFFVLSGAGEPTERFDTDDYTKAKKAIVDFVHNHKDRKGTLYTKDEAGSTW